MQIETFQLVAHLSCCELVETEKVPQFVLAGCSWLVDFVSQYEHGTIRESLVGEQRVQLDFALLEATAIPGVDEKNDGVDGREVILPHATCLRVSTQVECGEAHIAYGQLF